MELESNFSSVTINDIRDTQGMNGLELSRSRITFLAHKYGLAEISVALIASAEEGELDCYGRSIE
jgi:phosphopantetheine adenylyltransferase